MNNLPPQMEKLIDALSDLQGIGRRQAERMAFSILEMDEFDAKLISKSINRVKEEVMNCDTCGNITDSLFCNICLSEDRDESSLCVVSSVKDLINIEKTNKFNGKYLVLGGEISMRRGITPDKLRINKLLQIIDSRPIKEIILATNPSIEGETTAKYIDKIIESDSITKTRIAMGIPMGGSVNYADEFTIGKSLDNRRKM